MARTSITIAIEIDESVDGLEGRARLADGPWRTFHGWLGLAEAIDALAATTARSDAASSGASRRQKVDHPRGPKP